MIVGAMKELSIGNPKNLDVDCGPIINSAAQINSKNTSQKQDKTIRLLKSLFLNLKTAILLHLP